MKPIYIIKKEKGLYYIKRPDGSKVNESQWKDKELAEKHLEMLIAMKLCK